MNWSVPIELIDKSDMPQLSGTHKEDSCFSSDLLEVAVESKQFSQNIRFATEGAMVFTHEVEPNLAGTADRKPQGNQIMYREVGLDAISRQPAKAKTAAHRVDGSFDRTDLQNTLSQYARLVPEGPGRGALDGYEHMLHQVRAIELTLNGVQWMIAPRDGDHTDREDRFG